MEKSEVEILIRSQDGRVYRKFDLPLEVVSPEDWNEEVYGRDKKQGYVLTMGYTTPIAEYKEEKHAIHVMNYLLAKRNYYMFDSGASNLKSVILNVPTDELVRQTADEDLLDGIPVKSENEVGAND